MGTMASHITGVPIVYSTVCSGTDKKKSKLHVTGLCEGNSPVTGEFPHKGPVTWKMFPLDDIIILTRNLTRNLHCHVLSFLAWNMSCYFGQSACSIESRCVVMLLQYNSVVSIGGIHIYIFWKQSQIEISYMSFITISRAYISNWNFS